jgi:hypothetical protein
MPEDLAANVQKNRGRDPSWGWSGVAAVKFEGDDARLNNAIRLLPHLKSTPAEARQQLRELGARFQRRLHQDEFGPDRKRQTSTVRAIERSLGWTIRRLLSLSASLKQTIKASLSSDADPRDNAIDALLQAVLDVQTDLQRTGAKRRELLPLEKLIRTVRDLKTKFNNMDTNTDGQLFETWAQINFDPSRPVNYSAGLSGVQRWLKRYLDVVQKTLRRLNERRGTDERASLKLLVFELCEFWERETGRRVTAHGIVKLRYTSRAETPSGRFVTDAVEAMIPNQAWFDQRTHSVNSVRAGTYLPQRTNERAGQVLKIMRQFVKARHKSKR